MPTTWLAATIDTFAGSSPAMDRMTDSSPTRMTSSSG